MSESASKYYDIISPYYDKATQPENAWTPPSMVELFCKDFLHNNIKVLDIGIGTGQSIDFLTKANLQLTIDGIDVSEKMLEICREKYPTVTLHKSDLSNFTKETNTKFDIIISSGALEFIEDLNQFFANVKQLLAKNGAFIFTFEPRVEFHKYQAEAKSLTVPDKNSKLFFEDFYTYRRKFIEINHLLETNNLQIADSTDFVAYNKGGSDIIYTIIRAK